jgi:AcrR family transcriptional regulator
MTSETLPLRERKKRATRNALIAAARKLFMKKGYENTTLEEICDAVQVHVTTFFSYFESKEELAFARTLDNLEDLATRIQDRPEGMDVLTFWWKYLDDHGLRERSEEGALVARTDAVPALRNRFAMIQRQFEDVLAAALAKEAGKDPATDLYSQLQATTLMSNHVTASRWYRGAIGSSDPVTDTSIFARMAIEGLPTRKQVEAEVARISKAHAPAASRSAAKLSVAAPSRRKKPLHRTVR